MKKKTTNNIQVSVKFRLPRELKDKTPEGCSLKLTCGSSHGCLTSLGEFLVAVYEATGYSAWVFNDRHTGLDVTWVPVEIIERTMVGRKYLLEKLEWLAS